MDFPGCSASLDFNQFHRIAIRVAAEQRPPPGTTQRVSNARPVKNRDDGIQVRHIQRHVPVPATMLYSGIPCGEWHQFQQVDLRISGIRKAPGKPRSGRAGSIASPSRPR
jgi:hypothetical protein